jgi:sugar phosphate isomerase/epimerase
MPEIPIALQMYTIRDVAEADYVGALRKVAEIGYDGIELAGMPIPASEAKAVLAELGLKAPSMHAGYRDLISDAGPSIEMALDFGEQYITCAMLPRDFWSEEGYRGAAKELSRVGEECAKHGLELCYHNHAFEFQKFGGKYGYEILMGESNPKYLKAQIDTYWVQHGGEDPVGLIKRYAGRCPLIHMKDMAADAERSFAEVGEGILDFGAIIQASISAGAKWFIVEQDTCKGNALDCVRTSLVNLRKMLG